MKGKFEKNINNVIIFLLSVRASVIFCRDVLSILYQLFVFSWLHFSLFPFLTNLAVSIFRPPCLVLYQEWVSKFFDLFLTSLPRIVVSCSLSPTTILNSNSLFKSPTPFLLNEHYHMSEWPDILIGIKSNCTIHYAFMWHFLFLWTDSFLIVMWWTA